MTEPGCEVSRRVVLFFVFVFVYSLVVFCFNFPLPNMSNLPNSNCIILIYNSIHGDRVEGGIRIGRRIRSEESIKAVSFL